MRITHRIAVAVETRGTRRVTAAVAVRATRRIAVAAVLSVVAVSATAVLLARSADESPPVPATCPQRWGGERPGGWVPAAADIDGADESLVPGSPIQALICAYPGDNTRPGGERLAGSRTLTDQVGAMARDLGYVPVTASDRRRPCTLMGGTATSYLIRFAYPDGRALWLGEEPPTTSSGSRSAIRTGLRPG
ncbi:hypothetical protein [Planomonospora algeriensis]